MDIQTRIVLIAFVLFIFGGIYAILIAIRPFKPSLTWLSVLFGDLVTDVGSWAILLLITGNLYVALIPFMCHILTGGPMILGQVLKHKLQNGGHVVIDEELDDGYTA